MDSFHSIAIDTNNNKKEPLLLLLLLFYCGNNIEYPIENVAVKRMNAMEK